MSPVVIALTIYDAVTADWLALVAMVTFGLVLIMHEQASRWSWQQGFDAGVTGFSEALIRTESKDEGVRLLLAHPKPWEKHR
jgi:hypothetical protein